MRRLGVDPGSVRTGLAVCEEETAVAIPHKTVRHKSPKQAVAMVAQVIAELNIDEVIVGLPLRLDGTEGEAARRSRLFAGALQEASARAVVLWDERLSSVSANSALDAQGVRGKARRDVVDQAAATLLLQSYLDAQENATWDQALSEAELTIQPSLPPSKPDRRRKGGARRGRG